MITVAILGTLLAAVSTAFVAMLQVERNNTRVFDYARECLKFQNFLRQSATSAQQVVTPDGRTVRITGPDGTVSQVVYEDADGNWQTIEDNILRLDADITSGGDDTFLVRWVSPPNNGAGAIFSRDTTTGYSALRVDFIIGDNVADENAPCHAVTGPGWQSFRFRSRVSPRNAF